MQTFLNIIKIVVGVYIIAVLLALFAGNIS